MNSGSIRENFSKLLSKLPVKLRKVLFFPLKKRGILVSMLMAATLISISTLTIVGLELVYPSIIIGSGGTVNLPIGVGFYWNSNCTIPVWFVDWGDIEPGSIRNVTFFVRNEGSQSLRLNITAENWSPIEAASYMTFSMNYMDSAINPQEIIQITLSLTTSSQIEQITSFRFDINVGIIPVSEI